MVDEGKTGVAPIAVGVVLAILVIGGFLYFRNSTAPLRPDVSNEQLQEIKREEKKEERSLLSDLEKKYGPDHPQVKQMKMELGDAPFPDAPKD